MLPMKSSFNNSKPKTQKMEKEIIKSAKWEEDDKQEPYYGSTVVVWIKPKPGKYCEFCITVGDTKKSIMVQVVSFRI
jgi:hypothetical protein